MCDLVGRSKYITSPSLSLWPLLTEKVIMSEACGKYRNGYDIASYIIIYEKVSEGKAKNW